MAREKARRKLRVFVEAAWPVLEPPSRRFQANWHIDAICEHLEAVSRGQITRLLINIPPGHMKSLCASVLWQAWEWIDAPWTRWLTASYAAPLSIRDSVRARRVITSPWYRDNFGGVFRLLDDQNQKARFENDRTGYRIATSVGGVATGERGDRVVVDDPHNVHETLSRTQREAALVWWDETMTTRVNDPVKSGQVIIMQRLHARDLSGHVLEQGGWVHLMLPMAYEPDRRCVTALGFEDPRTDDGALLWPDRFGSSVLEDWERRLGAYAAAGQLQQRPAPREGGLFKRHWFEIGRASPAEAKRTRYWDFAATEEQAGTDPDYTAGARVAMLDGIYWIEDVRRERLSPLGVEKLVANTAAEDGREVAIGIEQEPGSSGKATVDHYRRRVLVGYACRGFRVTRSKVDRADPLSAAAEAGNVKLVAGPWNQAFLDEVALFPAGAHDDQVDAAAGAFNWLAARGGRRIIKLSGV